MDTRIALAGQNPDVYGALMRGWQGAEMRIQDVNAQQDRTRLRGALVGRYGEQLGALMELAPHAPQYEQNQVRLGVDQQRYDLDAQKYQSEQIVERGGMVLKMGEVLGSVPEGPEREAAFGEMVRQMYRIDPEGAEDLVGDFRDRSDAGIKRVLAGLSVYGEKPAAEPSVIRQAREIFPEWETTQAVPYRAWLQEKGGSSQNINLSITPEGNVLPSKSNATEAFTQLVSAGTSLNRLKGIREQYDPVFLTHRGKLSDFFLRNAEKLGRTLTKEEKEYVQQKQGFQQAVKREFNQYRREITGAAAALAEMEDLKESMMNEDQSPSQFEASYTAYAEERAYLARLSNIILRKGLEPGTQSFGEALDNLYLSGLDDDAKARADEIRVELRRKGVPEDELTAKTADILEEEGYQ